jgi:hypothetical protein
VDEEILQWSVKQWLPTGDGKLAVTKLSCVLNANCEELGMKLPMFFWT